MQTRSCVAVVVLVSTAFCLGSSTNGQEGAEAGEAIQLTKLLGQRRDVLLQLVEALEHQFSQGLCQVDSVVAAREQFLDAELQLASGKTERLEILQKKVDNMRELEDFMKIRHQDGRTTLENVLSATAARLQAEIDLVREKQ